MVDGYVSVASTFSQTISPRQAQASPFNLSYMHELHQATCTPCRLHGPFQAENNASNTCQFAVVLAWMAGQWRLPWLSGQPPPIPTSTPPNRGSFTLLPISLERPTEELIEHFLRPLQPDEGPAFVHPLLAVVKRYDIRQAAAAVTAFLADPEGDDVGEFLFWDQLASHDKAVYLPAVDELNDFIRFLSNVEPDKARRHTLAAVKVRPVVDMHAVNQLLPECRFSYPSPTDAAALVQPGFEMGKIDWYKAFNQFPVHEDDAKYMAVVIKGQCYVPKRALFGGSLFPHYVSTVMAAVVELMNAHDVPSTAMVDDFFTTGPPGPPSIPSCARTPRMNVVSSAAVRDN